jgi:hypothetical protein
MPDNQVFPVIDRGRDRRPDDVTLDEVERVLI